MLNTVTPAESRLKLPHNPKILESSRFGRKSLFPKEKQEQTRQPFFLQQLLEQQLLFQQQLLEKSIGKIRERSLRLPEIESKNSIWDAKKLADRFTKPEYSSNDSRRALLQFDAIHHAKEMALIEPITRFSYWHEPTTNETLGDGYSEDIGVMLNAFTQEIAQKGLESSRASIEAISFQRAKAKLTKIAQKKLKNSSHESGVLITSFPDDIASGYHGVDSKHNWDKPETHHSFFYFLRVGKIQTDSNGKLQKFEILTTQYRLWPNARQALEIHNSLNAPITDVDAPIPNLLFANLIELSETDLQKIANQLQIHNKQIGPSDNSETTIEQLLKKILYEKSSEHARSYSQVPEIPLDLFWKFQKKYFTEFYLKEALPVFEKITQLMRARDLVTQQLQHSTSHRKKLLLHKQRLQINSQIQENVDFLDKAFYYYSQSILGWIKIHNTNPDYEAAFHAQTVLEKLHSFRQKILFKLLGQAQETETIPSVSNLSSALDIDHRIATNQPVTADEKKQLLSVWGFFSQLGNISSLLQCGTLAPFTAPISIMNKSFDAASMSSFSQSLGGFSIPERKKLLDLFQSEEYVELDLTSSGAKKIYSVPKSYIQNTANGEPGCIVNENGQVLGPCIDPETNQRIPLDDPRDTLAFPLTLEEFQKYILELQNSIQDETITQLNEFFDSPLFSSQQQKKARYAIKKIRQKFIKESIGLSELFTGDILAKNQATHEWLQGLLIKLSFSLNPVETLVQEIQDKLNSENEQKTAKTTVDEVIAELDEE